MRLPGPCAVGTPCPYPGTGMVAGETFATGIKAGTDFERDGIFGRKTR